jgi:hypothetical protein
VGGVFSAENLRRQQGFAGGGGSKAVRGVGGAKTCAENWKNLFAASFEGQREESQSKPFFGAGFGGLCLVPRVGTMADLGHPATTADLGHPVSVGDLWRQS